MPKDVEESKALKRIGGNDKLDLGEDNIEKENDFDLDDDFDSDSSHNRSPITKVRKEVSKRIVSVADNAIPAFRSRIEDKMPKAASMVNEVSSFMNSADYLKDKFTSDLQPSITQLKDAGRKIGPHIKPLLPGFAKKFYDKITKEEDTGSYKPKSKEELEKESISSEINEVLGKQFKANLDIEEERKKDNLIDRAISDSQHKQEFGQLSVIRGTNEFQVNFLRNAQLPYMKKTLELKLRHIFIAKETRDRIKIVSEILENKLEQIRHNTALPDIQKRQKLEALKSTAIESFNSKIVNAGSDILNRIKDRILDPVKETIETAASASSMFAESLEGEKASGLNTLLGLATHFGAPALGGWAGKKLFGDVVKGTTGILGNRAAYLNEQFGTLEDYLIDRSTKAKLNKGSSLINDIMNPRIDPLSPIKNNQFVGLEDATGFKNKDSLALTAVIPGLLSKQLQQLTILNTGKNAEELVYDYGRQDFITASKYRGMISLEAFGSKENRAMQAAESQARIKSVVDRTVSNTQYKSNFETFRKDIHKLLVNCASMGDNIQADVIHDHALDIESGNIDKNDVDFETKLDRSEAEMNRSSYIAGLLKGIPDENKDNVILILDSILYDGDKLNHEVLRALNTEVREYIKKSDNYRKILSGVISSGNARFIRGNKGYLEGTGSSFSISQKSITDAFLDYKEDDRYRDKFEREYESKTRKDTDLLKGIEEESSKVYDSKIANAINKSANFLFENLDRESIAKYKSKARKTIDDFTQSAVDKLPEFAKELYKERKDYNKKKKEYEDRLKTASEKAKSKEIKRIIKELEESPEEDSSIVTSGGFLKDLNEKINNLPYELSKKILKVRVVNFDEFEGKSHKKRKFASGGFTDGSVITDDTAGFVGEPTELIGKNAIVGDADVPEAIIPLDGSKRSRRILRIAKRHLDRNTIPSKDETIEGKARKKDPVVKRLDRIIEILENKKGLFGMSPYGFKMPKEMYELIRDLTKAKLPDLNDILGKFSIKLDEHKTGLDRIFSGISEIIKGLGISVKDAKGYAFPRIQSGYKTSKNFLADKYSKAKIFAINKYNKTKDWWNDDISFMDKLKDKRDELLFVDVYRKNRVDPRLVLLTAAQQKEGVFLADGKRLKSTYLIDQPVLSGDGLVTYISQEDIDHGIVDANGNSINVTKEIKDIYGLARATFTTKWNKVSDYLNDKYTKGMDYLESKDPISYLKNKYLQGKDKFGKLLGAGLDLAKGTGNILLNSLSNMSLPGFGIRSLKPVTNRLDVIIDILNWKFNSHFRVKEDESEDDNTSASKISVIDRIKDKYQETRDNWFSTKTKAEQDAKVKDDKSLSRNPLEDRRRREEEKEEADEKKDRKDLVSSLKGLKEGLVGKEKKKGIFGLLLSGMGLMLAPLKGMYKLTKGIFNFVKPISLIKDILKAATIGIFKLGGGALSGAGKLLGGLAKGFAKSKIGKIAIGGAGLLGLTSLLGGKSGTPQSSEVGTDYEDPETLDLNSGNKELQNSAEVIQPGVNKIDLSKITGIEDSSIGTNLAMGIGGSIAADYGISKIKDKMFGLKTPSPTVANAATEGIGKSIANNATKQGFKLGAKTVFTKLSTSVLGRVAAGVLGGPVGWGITAGSIILPMLAETKMGKSLMRSIGFRDSKEIEKRRDMYGLDKNVSLNDVIKLEHETKTAIDTNSSLGSDIKTEIIEQVLGVKLPSNYYPIINNQTFDKYSTNRSTVSIIMAYRYFEAWYTKRFLPIYSQVYEILKANNLSLDNLDSLDDDTKNSLDKTISQISERVVGSNGDIKFNRETFEETVKSKLDRNKNNKQDAINSGNPPDLKEESQISVTDKNANINSTVPRKETKVNTKLKEVKDPISAANDVLTNSILSKQANSLPLGIDNKDSVKDRAKLYGIKVESRGFFGIADPKFLMLELERLANNSIDNQTGIKDKDIERYASLILLDKNNQFVNSKDKRQASIYFAAWLKRRFLPIFMNFKNIAAKHNLHITEVDDANDETKKKIISELVQQSYPIINQNSKLVCDPDDYKKYVKEVEQQKNKIKRSGNGGSEAIQNYKEDYGDNARPGKDSPTLAENEVLRDRTKNAVSPDGINPDGSINENYGLDVNGLLGKINEDKRRVGDRDTKAPSSSEIMNKWKDYKDDDLYNKTNRSAYQVGLDVYNKNQSAGIDLGKINIPTIPKSSGEKSELGKYVQKFESGSKGPLTVAWDSTGGTSYGTYQVAARRGSAKEFINWASKHGGEFGKQFNEAMWKANSQLPGGGGAHGLDSGSKEGPTVDVWKKFASKDKEGFNNLEHEFIKTKHYDPALNGLPGDIRQAVENDRGLQEALWSSAIQHGPGGARSIFKEAWKKTGGKGGEDFIKAIYSIRGTKFPSSTQKVRTSVQNRFKEEVGIALGLSKQQKPLGSEDSKKDESDTGSETFSNDGPPTIGLDGNSVNASKEPVSIKSEDSSNIFTGGNNMGNLDNVTPENPSGKREDSYVNDTQTNNTPTDTSGTYASANTNDSTQGQDDQPSGAGANAIEKYLSVAKKNAQSAKGYSQDKRTAPDYYDCSSFVSRTLKGSGFDVNPNNTTATLKSDLQKVGFTYHRGRFGPISEGQLKPGDILLGRSEEGASHNHTEIFTGFKNGKPQTVGAHSTSSGVSERNHYPGYNYSGFLRLSTQPDLDPELAKEEEENNKGESQQDIKENVGGEGTPGTPVSDNGITVTDKNSINATANSSGTDYSDNTGSSASSANLPAIPENTSPAPVEQAKAPEPQQPQFDVKIFSSIDEGIKTINSTLVEMLKVQQSMIEVLAQNSNTRPEPYSNDSNINQVNTSSREAPISMSRTRAA